MELNQSSEIDFFPIHLSFLQFLALRINANHGEREMGERDRERKREIKREKEKESTHITLHMWD